MRCCLEREPPGVGASLSPVIDSWLMNSSPHRPWAVTRNNDLVVVVTSYHLLWPDNVKEKEGTSSPPSSRQEQEPGGDGTETAQPKSEGHFRKSGRGGHEGQLELKVITCLGTYLLASGLFQVRKKQAPAKPDQRPYGRGREV